MIIQPQRWCSREIRGHLPRPETRDIGAGERLVELGHRLAHVERPILHLEHESRLDAVRVVAVERDHQHVVVALDGPYGNLVTNVSSDAFRELGYELGDSVRVQLGSTTLSVPFQRTFGEVAPGRPLLFVDSRGMVSLAINQGNFAQQYRVTPPLALVIARR